jgi:hypothetical protein
MARVAHMRECGSGGAGGRGARRRFAGSSPEELELEHPAMSSTTEKLYTELGTRGTQPHALGGNFGYE